MKVDTLIHGGLVVNAWGVAQQDVAIRSGIVCAVGTGLRGQVEVEIEEIDARGLLVLPGLVDPHTHMNDVGAGGIRTSDDWVSGSAFAASGGVTTIIDFTTPTPGQDPVLALAERRASADGVIGVDYSLHGIIDSVGPDTPAKMRDVVEAGAPSFKVFTTYEGLALDTGSLWRVMLGAADVSGLVCAHAENDEIISYYVKEFTAKGNTSAYYHGVSRPAFTEVEAVQRLLTLNHAAGGRLYLVHLSTAGALEAVEAAKRAGQQVWAETCPHYLLLDDSYLATPHGGRYIMSPPLRTVSDSDRLWQGIAAGTISCVASDHCPFPLASREDIPFGKAPNGVGSTGLILPLMYSEGVVKGRIGLERLVAVTSYNASRIMGLWPRKGAIAPGFDADVALYDPSSRSRVHADELPGGGDYSIYDGWTISGNVRMTLLRGKTVYCGDRTGKAPIVAPAAPAAASASAGEFVSRSALSGSSARFMKETDAL